MARTRWAIARLSSCPRERSWPNSLSFSYLATEVASTNGRIDGYFELLKWELGTATFSWYVQYVLQQFFFCVYGAMDALLVMPSRSLKRLIRRRMIYLTRRVLKVEGELQNSERTWIVEALPWKNPEATPPIESAITPSVSLVQKARGATRDHHTQRTMQAYASCTWASVFVVRALKLHL